MNKQIIFRGKSIQTGKWIYGGYYFWNGETFIIPYDKFAGDEYFSEALEDYCVEPDSVGQKWERSMKEFYGGDLFKAMSSASGSKKKKIHLCKVVDSESGMDVVVWHEGEWWGYSYMNFCDIERVGNIFDNADLVSF